MANWNGLYKKQTEPDVITREDVEDFRESLKIGNKVEINVLSTSLDQGGRYPIIRKRLPMIHISKWVVVVFDMNTGQKYTEQIKQLLINQRNQKGRRNMEEVRDHEVFAIGG